MIAGIVNEHRVPEVKWDLALVSTRAGN